MKKKKAKTKSRNKPFIFQTYINSFHYLYQDATYIYNLATDKKMQGRFERVRLSRTALLLYILSMEALINRAMDHLLSADLHDFFMEREDKFSLQDKWLLLPLLAGKKGSRKFNTTKYPWSHFNELVSLRNDFVHPKHDRVAYYTASPNKKVNPLDYNKIPKDLPVKEKGVVYRNTLIPKDPYAILPIHVEKTKKIVDDMIQELDKLLDGKIMKDNWLAEDAWQLIYPKGKTIKDLGWNDQDLKIDDC